MTKPQDHVVPPTGSTFAERARARAQAEANGTVAPETPRRSLRAGVDAEGTGTVRIAHVQN